MRALTYRSTAVAVASVALCTSLGQAPAQATSANEWRVPLTEATVRTDLVAASGSSILVFAQSAYRLSTDSGAHWKTVTPALSGASGADTPDFVQDGVAAFRVAGKGEVVSLSAGASRQVDLSGISVDANANDGDPLVALTDTHALLYDGGAVELSTLSSALVAQTPVAVAWADLPAAPSRSVAASDRWSLDHGFGYHLRAYTNSKGVDLATDIDPAALDGSAGPAAFRVPGELMFQVLIDPAHLEYAYRDASAVRRCVRDLTASTSTCARLRAVSHRAARVYAQRMGTALVLAVGNTVYSCTEGIVCKPARVRLPRGLAPMGTGGLVGDPQQPVLSLGRSAPGPLYTITAARRTVKLSDALTAPQVPSALELTASRLVGMDGRSSPKSTGAGLTAWQRSLDDSTIGPETVLGHDVTDVAASAARVATNGRSRLVFYDDGRASQSTNRVGALGALSGPYPLVTKSHVDYVGLPLASLTPLPGAVEDDFGTRLLSLSQDGSELVVADSSDASYRREVALPSGLADNTIVAGARLWSDRIGVTFLTYRLAANGFVVSCASRVLDLSAAEPTWSDAEAGELVGLADGLAVLRDQTSAGVTVSTWNLVSGEVVPLRDAASSSYPSVDGGRVAYATAKELVVREVPGTSGSAPRMLGVVAADGCNAWACAWSPQVDLTKGVDVGSIVIRNADDAVVRTLATPKSAGGSIRGVTWNGKLDDGSFAPAGTYTWELSAQAIDGSGAVVAVDGSPEAGGRIAVTRASIGKLRLGVSISDRTPAVGQVLTAAVQVSAADAELSYSWYAGSTVVSAGTGDGFAAYLVQATDAGKRLRLVVSAAREGADPASKASARTDAVR